MVIKTAKQIVDDFFVVGKEKHTAQLIQDIEDFAAHILKTAPITYENICKCKPDETTGSMEEWVCNNCGRTQK